MIENGEQDTMKDEPIETLLTNATNQEGVTYLESRDAMLEKMKEDPAELGKIQNISNVSMEWREQLTAQMVTGWLVNKEKYELCRTYASGDLPGIPPLPGFTDKHRARAIAAMGTSVTPRVLEMVWKTTEYQDGMESGALFGALIQLEDQRAIMPMIDLLDQKRQVEEQNSAILVLSKLGDSRGLERLMSLTSDPTLEDVVRVRAIRALGRYDDPKALEMLTKILLREAVTDKEFQAAAKGLAERLAPSTRSVVVEALGKTWNEDNLVILVGIIGEIGIPDDIPALEQAAWRSELVKEEVSDAIEDIHSRKESQ